MLLGTWTRAVVSGHGPVFRLPVTESNRRLGTGACSANTPRVQLPELGVFLQKLEHGACWLSTARAELAVMKKILSGGSVFVHGVLVQASLSILHHPECVLFLKIKTKQEKVNLN
ncbi:hypothetical protein HanRHA438_Chr10g0450311 [Helianthus annuus]|nr:hypothetical protein HanRHA438_Chr10g0450311 [Helianthus annuus]